MLHSSKNEMVQIKVVAKYKNTYFIFSNFFSENCTAYVIMWTYMIKLYRRQITMKYLLIIKPTRYTNFSNLFLQ